MTTKKVTIITYAASALAGLLAAALVAGLAFDQGVLYSIFWGLFGGGVALTVARTALHLVRKDYAPEMWQISLYMLLACGGWLGGILSISWGGASLALAVMVTAMLMAVGTRFCKEVAIQRTASSLERTLRYKPTGDVLGAAPNLDAPLIMVQGNAMTVEEADKAGVPAEKIKEARSYIDTLTGRQEGGK